MEEIYKSIPGFDGYYECSDRGNVRSLDRTVTYKNGRVCNYKGKIMKQILNPNGYLQTSLNKEGKQQTYGIHQLVAMTYMNHIMDGHKTEVDHIDHTPLNNCLSNLQLISKRENSSKDRWRHNYSSKAVGVHWHNPAQKWKSHIQINGKQIHLGLFIDEDEAAQAYQLAVAFIDQYSGDAKAFRNFIKSKM